MNHVFNFLLIGLLLINFCGLTVWVMHLSRLVYGLAKVVTLVGVCLIFFFIEHFIGLGNLGWLLPISTAGAVIGLWKHREYLTKDHGAEIAFLAGFGYALLWRYFSPNIDPSSEKIADLSYIAGYLRGTQLPATDLWLPPYKLTQYYAFQHYGAALLGRIMALPAGTAYNIAYCVVVGLVLAPAYEFVKVFVTKRWGQSLILAALLLGGTGACIVTPFMLKNETPWASMRFVGSADITNDAQMKPLGIAIKKLQYGDDAGITSKREGILEMPMEIFSYVVQLGDYHPPLGGYVLLAAALAAFGMLLGKTDVVSRRWALGALTGTVPLCIVVNTWVFPFQAMLVVGCLAFLWAYRERLIWAEVIVVSLIPWVLLYPCFAYFLTLAVGGAMKVKLVGASQHAPVLSYLLQMWPTLGLVGFAWFACGKGRREYRWLVLFVAFLLVLMEIINIDDLYSGRFERFNTTLKWWPWVAALSILLLAPLSFSANCRLKVPRIGTVLILLLSLCFIKSLSREWWNRPKVAAGRLDGAEWLRQIGQNPTSSNLSISASMLNYLNARPGGTTLEFLKPERMAFVETGAISLFTGHPTLIGWVSHEQLWRGYQGDIDQRRRFANEFLRGEVPMPLDSLKAYDVQFILWPGAEDVDAALFDKIKAQIGSRYAFVRFDESQPRKGLWERKIHSLIIP